MRAAPAGRLRASRSRPAWISAASAVDDGRRVRAGTLAPASALTGRRGRDEGDRQQAAPMAAARQSKSLASRGPAGLASTIRRPPRPGTSASLASAGRPSPATAGTGRTRSPPASRPPSAGSTALRARRRTRSPPPSHPPSAGRRRPWARTGPRSPPPSRRGSGSPTGCAGAADRDASGGAPIGCAGRHRRPDDEERARDDQRRRAFWILRDIRLLFRRRPPGAVSGEGGREPVLRYIIFRI
jgi:hypothetical protein